MNVTGHMQHATYHKVPRFQRQDEDKLTAVVLSVPIPCPTTLQHSQAVRTEIYLRANRELIADSKLKKGHVSASPLQKEQCEICYCKQHPMICLARIKSSVLHLVNLISDNCRFAFVFGIASGPLFRHKISSWHGR